MYTVIDVITAPEKINSTSKGRIFQSQKNCVEPSWRLNYGDAYALQLVRENGCGLAQFHQFSLTSQLHR